MDDIDQSLGCVRLLQVGEVVHAADVPTGSTNLSGCNRCSE